MAAALWFFQPRGRRRRDRIFRDRDNPFDYETEKAIFSKYRLPRHIIIQLCQQFEYELKRPTLRSCALPVSLQIMIALRFFATGSFQAVVGDIHNISRQSASYVISDVVESLVRVANTYIFMATNQGALNEIKRRFHEIAGFPTTIGVIDGTHIKIKAPSTDEHLYVNRKHFHSINVQCVCDSKLNFFNIVAKWPGGTHDSFIWNNSSLKLIFDNGTILDGWLLGDSAYPLRPWLLTPVLNPITPSENRYNSVHVNTRNTIERAIGVFKSRFRCIDFSGGTLIYTPKKACRIAVAVAVLHSLCVDNNVPLPDRNDPVDHGLIRGTHYQGNNMNDGARTKEMLINGRFSH